MTMENKWWAGEWWSITPEAAHRIPTTAGPGDPGSVGVMAPYTVDADGTAALAVKGILGVSVVGSSYKGLTDAARAADADPKVKAIRFDVNSPGGLVAGAHEAARAIHGLTKPTLALISGEACSAAYWLASACDSIEASPTAVVGCLGTMITIVAPPEGKDSPLVKIIASQTPRKGASPASEDGHGQYQAVLDAQAAVFLNDVAEFRGISYSEVSGQYGGGAMMAATPALEAGMIDSVTGSALAAEPSEGEADMVDAESKALTPEEQIKELEKQLEEKNAIVLDLEDRLKKLEEAASKDAGAEAAAEDMTEEKPEEVPEAVALLTAKVATMEAEAAVTKRNADIDTRIAGGFIAPSEKAVAVALFDAEQRGEHTLFTDTYASRTEAVVDLTVHSHGAEEPTLSNDPADALIQKAVAYCETHDMNPDGPDFGAALIHVQNATR